VALATFMNRWLTRLQRETLLEGLTGLREGLFVSGGAEGEGATALVAAYRRLGLGARALEWVRRWPGEGREFGRPTGRWWLEAAWVHRDAGDLERAQRCLEAWGLEPEADLDPCPAWELQAVLALDRTPAEAFAPLERALRHLRKFPSTPWLVRFSLLRVRWFLAQGRGPEASALARRTLALARTDEDPLGELEVLAVLATEPGASRAKARRAAQAVEEAADRLEVPEARVWALGLLASEELWEKEVEGLRAYRRWREALGLEARDREALDRRCQDLDRAFLARRDEVRRLQASGRMADLARSLAVIPTLAQALDSLYGPLGDLMAADIFGVALWVPEKRCLDYALFLEQGHRTSVGLIPVDSRRSLGAWCFRHGEGLRVDDIDLEYSRYLQELSQLADHRPKSMLFEPLVTDRGVVGVVTVQAFARGAYGPEAQARLRILASLVALRLQS